MHHQDFILLLHGFILLLVHGSSASHQRRGLGAGVSQVTDFDCPEEFGYYPHPTDCSQYYVCVFGGALLESCTGGLMYSHELQTCDWPRNVGCGESSDPETGSVSTIRVTEPRSRTAQHSRNSQQQSAVPSQQSQRNSHRVSQEYIRHRQPEVIQQQLYTEEDLGPAEEIETDRQQRIYRGQPSTIGQVQRDRDGLRNIKASVHSHNVIPAGPETQEKISVVSFASQRTSAPRPQEQYRKNLTYDDDDYKKISATLTDDNELDNNVTLTRRKRQVSYRLGSYEPVRGAKIPVILIPEAVASARYFGNQLNNVRLLQSYQNETFVDTSQFRPILYNPVRYIETAINPFSVRQGLVSNVPNPVKVVYRMTNRTEPWRTFFGVQDVLTTTERVVAITSRKKDPRWTTEQFSRATETPQNVYFVPGSQQVGRYRFVETPTNYRYQGGRYIATTDNYYQTVETTTTKLAESNNHEQKNYNSEFHSSKDYDSGQSDYDDYYEETTLKQKSNVTTLPTKFYVPGDRVNMETVLAISNNLNRPLRFRSTTTKPTVQVQPPREPHPTDTTDKFFDYSRLTTQRGIKPVQSFQVTSALPSLTLTPTQRTIEGYNTSQRFQPNQYDQYYTVYDEDADLYRGDDYVQQEFHSPSSTPSSIPSSNIVHQYRGQTTFKQAQQQQVIELQRQQQSEPVQSQPLLTYNRDAYSPPPVVQDYNDQYNTQIDDQQLHTSPKPQSRSVATNSSKDDPVTRAPENATKPEVSALNRRSDSYFEPSEILVPPPRSYPQPTPSTTYPTQAYQTVTTSRGSSEPPRNGGALAKTLNNFDSLLTNFFSSVTGPTREKASPETIVRSEIGRIHHDPIVITDYEPKNKGYLGYYVQIEPKKTKEEVVTKDNIRPGQSDEVGFSLRGRRPYSTYVRVIPGEGNRNIQLTASLDIEPILRTTTEAPRIVPYQFPTTEEIARNRGGNIIRPLPEEPKLIENANPYKFVVVDTEKPKQAVQTPSPFNRNPENEERSEFQPEEKPQEPTESNVIQTDFEEEEERDTSEETKPETSTSVEATTLARKPFRIRVPTEDEEVKKNRRIIKIHRSELRNQRLNQQKYKRIRKTSTQAPSTASDDLTFNRENEIQSTYKPIIVVDGLAVSKELTGSNESNFRYGEPPKTLGLYPIGNETVVDSPVPVTRAYDKPRKPIFPPVDLKPILIASREPPSSEKPLFLITTTQTNKNVTVHENRVITTAKPYVRGKFKPSENSKLRFRPTTASPDSETTPGPHLSTRQPAYTTASTGNEVTVNRGTPPTKNRGTRPTLKPSTEIVSKATEFIDIYKYPPRRPENLFATPTPNKYAATCRMDVCVLPDCFCGGPSIPGGLRLDDTPQLVLLTFDDSVNDLNKDLYSELFEKGRVNPNGCPISATFYVSHEWTDYSQVQNLYASGHEIASHSISHSFGEKFSQERWTKEIAGQREILAAYGGVRLEDIRGMRAPFLAIGGNKMFKMLYDSNFTYDSSMPIYENRPPSYPYTLDYRIFHDCMIPPCPTKSYPGVWEVPMVMWQDLNGGRCSMGDACSNPPDTDGVYKLLVRNFERHIGTSRAPFGLYYHSAWFTQKHHKEGFIAFVDTLLKMPQVWFVTTWQALQWVRNPQPRSKLKNFMPFQCNVEKAKRCNNPKVCNLWHEGGVRYMKTCQPCPDVYPWTGRTGVKNSRVDNEIVEEQTSNDKL